MSNRPETDMWNLSLAKTCGIGVTTLWSNDTAGLSEDGVKHGRNDVQSCGVVTAAALM